MTTFPTRVLIMPDFLPEVRADFEARSFLVVELTTPVDLANWAELLRAEFRKLGLGSTDLVVALPSWVDVALEELGIPVPEPPDYPTCLTHLLRRNVFKSTLGKLKVDLFSLPAGQQLFIKPVAAAKSFSGTVVTAPVDDMLELFLDSSIFPALGPDVEIHCSEVLEMNSEYAVYVVDGRTAATCHYMCKKSTCRCKDGDRAAAGEAIVELDNDVVNEAIQLLSSSEETKKLTGYRADFALVRNVGPDGCEMFETVLVEVNDGYVSGRYDGMSPKDFGDMLITRFAALQSF